MRLMVNCETLLSFPTRTGLRVLSRWGRLRLATPARPAWFTVMVRVGLGHVGWWLLGTGAPSSSRAAADQPQGHARLRGALPKSLGRLSRHRGQAPWVRGDSARRTQVFQGSVALRGEAETWLLLRMRSKHVLHASDRAREPGPASARQHIGQPAVPAWHVTWGVLSMAKLFASPYFCHRCSPALCSPSPCLSSLFSLCPHFFPSLRPSLSWLSVKSGLPWVK